MRLGAHQTINCNDFATYVHFQDLCIQVPILKFPDEGFAACNRVEGKSTTEDSWAQFEDFADFDEEFENFGKNDSGDGLFAPLLGFIIVPLIYKHSKL